jgi:TetR/AcrR family transcriptional repressor of bet genes
MPKIGMREVRRAQLIEATLHTIEEAGLSATTLALVAQRANISTGIVSHYFGDKNGLIEATMRHILRDLWAATARRRTTARADPRSRLRAIVAANFDVSQVSAPVMKTWLAFWSQSMHEPTLKRLQRVNMRRLYSNLCAEFGKAMPRTAARRAANGLAAMIDGLWLHGALNGATSNASNTVFDTKAAIHLANSYIDLLLVQHV